MEPRLILITLNWQKRPIACQHHTLQQAVSSPHSAIGPLYVCLFSCRITFNLLTLFSILVYLNPVFVRFRV